MKCLTCNDTGYYINPEPWNATLQEVEECPDCDIKPTDQPKSLVGLVT